MTRFALPSTGSSWVSSPASLVLRRTPTPCRPSHEARCLASWYRYVRSFFALCAVSAQRTAWGWSPDSHDRLFRGGDGRVSQVPGESHTPYVLQVHDPDGPQRQNWLRRCDAAFHSPQSVGTSDAIISRLNPEARKASLCTLRSGGYPTPRNTRFLARPASPGGVATQRDLIARFRVTNLSSILLAQALPGARGV